MNLNRLVVGMTMGLVAFTTVAQTVEGPRDEDKVWLLPTKPPYPNDNEPTPARVLLGKTLFFDRAVA